jgi:hypothetical protein
MRQVTLSQEEIDYLGLTKIIIPVKKGNTIITTY